MLSTVIAVTAMLFSVASCERYDLDERMPGDLGPSIYDYLKENGFDTYVRLIEEPGLAGPNQSYYDVLSKTGSKTMFVADEEAVNRFYASGVFKRADGSPVKCYEDLSLSQKKMMLFGALLDNVYQAAFLSNRENENDGEPIKGDCMRRVSLLTEIYDTVRYMTAKEMPDNPYWSSLKNSGNGVRCLSDATKRPRVMITPKFLERNKFTNDDYNFVFHHSDGQKREPDEVSINGIPIISRDNKCLNGFVHVTKEVVCPLPNMAERIATLPNTTVFNAILQRFNAPFTEFPYPGGESNPQDPTGTLHTNTYNTLYNDTISALYQARFFSARSQPTSKEANGDSLYMTTRDTANVKDFMLRYDPGWNSYFTSAGGIAENLALQKDMAVMLVPNDAIMEEWWNSNALKERYGHSKEDVHGAANVIEDMKDVPNRVIVELINNGMLASFVSSVPSKFADVLNDANDPMGIVEKDVDDVQVCCNGAIYVTNKVFAPTTYRSVAFPTLVDASLKVIDWAIENCHFKPYMNSMVSHYSFFIPKGRYVERLQRDNCLVYLSPVIESSTQKYNYVYVFYFDEFSKDVKAEKYVYDKDAEDHLGERKDANCSANEISNILTDLLDYHIVIGDAEDVYELGKPSEYKYFKTKGGGTVMFKLENDGENVYRRVWGGYQLEKSSAGIEVGRVYDQRGTSDGNGRSYVIPEALNASSFTVAEILNDNTKYPEFSEFGKLLMSSELISSGDLYGGDNISVFSTFNYSVYVPQNEYIARLLAEKKIISGDMIGELQEYYENLAVQCDADEYKMIGTRLSRLMRGAEPGDTTDADRDYTVEDYIKDLKSELDNFIRYHLQDNSLYIGGNYESNTMYETSYMKSWDRVYAKLYIQTAPDGTILVKENANVSDADAHRVVTDDPKYYNIMCREYKYKNDSGIRLIETSSYAVVHLIDTPLNYADVSKYHYGERSLYFKIDKE